MNVDEVKKDQIILDGDDKNAGCNIEDDDKEEILDCNKKKCSYSWRTGAWSKVCLRNWIYKLYK